ncbi:MAG: nucleotide sugar dehydrogenase [Candidatus Omnitrophota bacterium]|jgi:UDP-N-acetyl-D-glucosamine dehydrogenase
MNSLFREIEQKLKKNKFSIAVVGLGYVGLPLAIEFAKKRIRVSGIEIDGDRLKRIRKKESYITDISSEELGRVLNSGYFCAYSDFKFLKSADVIIICVPTPLKGKYHPDISYIRDAVISISKHIKKGSLVILESTTYPGTTEEIILPLLENGRKKHGKDFYLCFSPERIDPGNSRYPVYKIPKVVGGLSSEAVKLAVLVYKKIINKVIAVSSARAAELTKLLENTFRLVNIGMIDEMAMMAYKMNIDIWEVIKAASTKPFGFMPFYPGPGVGGHCIPKDPLYLYWKAKHFGFKSRFIKLASEVISYMPEYVVERVRKALEERKIRFKNAKILVIGLTYKKDIRDLRKSPSLDIINALKKRNIKVHYHDPLIPYLDFDHLKLKSVDLKRNVLSKYDCVIIATDHSCLDYGFILKNSSLIFDTRNIYAHAKERKVVML